MGRKVSLPTQAPQLTRLQDSWHLQGSYLTPISASVPQSGLPLQNWFLPLLVQVTEIQGTEANNIQHEAVINLSLLQNSVIFLSHDNLGVFLLKSNIIHLHGGQGASVQQGFSSPCALNDSPEVSQEQRKTELFCLNIHVCNGRFVFLSFSRNRGNGEDGKERRQVFADWKNKI